MIDSRTRIQCISDGIWKKLSDWEKTCGLIAFSEGNYESKDFGSIEAFICWYHRERLTPEDVLEVNNAMFLKKPDEKDLKPIELDEFEISLMELIRKDVKPSKSVCDSPNTENKKNP